jgi:hypothetical protein
MTFTFHNRPVGNFEVDDVDTRDYPDFSDAFINYAEWLDTHTPLNDAELELLNNESDLVYEAVLNYVFLRRDIMNYADNDEIYNEIVRIGQGKFTDEQIYQIAYMVICARLQGRDSAFIEATRSLTTQTETV